MRDAPPKGRDPKPRESGKPREGGKQ
jgi:hypothetical protein